MACLYSKSRIIKPVNTFLSAKIFYPIAKISYSIYLFHVMFMEWLFPMISEYAEGSLTSLQIVFVNGIISLVGSIAIAALMVIFIEEPFNTLKNTLTSKKQRSASTVNIVSNL
jgi:peptidoglycan/LPS O-acetylase OafA/YrhL